MREDHRELVIDHARGVANGLRLLDLLFNQPIVTISLVQRLLDVTYPTASSIVSQLTQGGILVEMTGGARNRRYAYGPYLELFTAPSDSERQIEARSSIPRTQTELP